MRATLAYLPTLVRFPLALRRFVIEPKALDTVRQQTGEQLRRRSDNLLRLLESSVYGVPRSPYRAMLRQARCEFGDVRALLAEGSVEDALRALRAADVYVTFEELKGRVPIVRDGRHIAAGARDFDNPGARHDLTLTTGGSTGLANVVYQDLDHIDAMAGNEMLVLAAHAVLHAPTVHWSHALPGSGIRFILQRVRHGQLRQRWFCPAGWRDTRNWRRYGLTTLYMLACMRALGLRVNVPTVVRPDQALVVARAVRAHLDREGLCLLYSSVSGAVRVSLAATAAGFDLAGATMRLASEPLTPAKRERIEVSGARVLAGYGSIETGAIALGCLRPHHADDVHVLADAFAVIDQPHAVGDGGVTVPALNLTGLRASAPKVLLNYQIDDYGTLDTAPCGCAVEALGYGTRLHSIRSYSKLVGEGVTLVGNDLLAILETDLPGRFGGTPLDYQLQEREDEQGLTRVVLIVSPRVALAADDEVVAFVLGCLAARSPMADAARSVWQAARTLRVERGEPVLSARGKQQALHVARRGEGRSGR